MDLEELRSRQAPLKQRYRESADAARIPARAECRLDMEDMACVVRSWRGETIAGLHQATGGTGELACSADMLLEALVACAGVTLRAVAAAMGVALRGARVLAEGHWDARGTLAVDKSAPVGLTDIALTFELDTDAEPAKLARLIESAERYCVIAQTLRNPPKITVAHRVAADIA
jgi:uncharacterized OsmC-like protein